MKNESEILPEELITISMDIIVNAGKAQEKIAKAIDQVSTFQFDGGNESLEEARKFLVVAHKRQTSIVQSEANGEEIVYSILFSHAQDTLMTIKSEYNVAVNMIKLFKALDQKIEAVQKQMEE